MDHKPEERVAGSPGTKRAWWKKLVLVGLGFFLALVLVEVGLRTAGWILLAVRERENRISLENRGEFRVLCLGESTTAGGKDSYPRQLEEILNEQKTGLSIKVVNKGVEGTDTAKILGKLDGYLEEYAPDLVVTMMGVNDYMQLGTTIPYQEPIGGRIARFFESLRVYKLGRYAWDSLLGRDPFHVDGLASESLGETGTCYSFQQMLGDVTDCEESGEQGRNLKLVRCLLRQGRFQPAKQLLDEILAGNPENDRAIAELGWYHILQKRFHTSSFRKARPVFEKVLDLNPKNYQAIIGLGFSLYNLGDRMTSRLVFARAVEVEPDLPGGYVGLGYLCLGDGAESVAVDLLNMAIEKDSRFILAYAELARFYKQKNQHENVRNTYLRAIEAGVRNDIFCGHLAQCYHRLNDPEQAGKYREMANHIRLSRFRPATRYNYNQLKEKVLAKGLKLVCMQYPLRNISPLKKLLHPADGVIFVDNEQVFRRALMKEGYDYLFTDRFGGDFGHCTREGNRVLAGNLAAVIMREVLGKAPGKTSRSR